MEEFVPFDSSVHMEAFIQMNVEYLTWVYNKLDENYNVDVVSILGQTVQEFVNDHLEPYISLRPPEGILYILEVDGEVAGMGAIQKLDNETGEFKRMYNRPRHRGKGYGRMMFNRLREVGRELGCSSFRLDTPMWAQAAQHIYRSAGFTEIEAYPESEIPPKLRPYWIWMEKEEE